MITNNSTSNKSINFHPVIQEIGFDFWWNTEKLWSLDLPIEEINISELEWYFELPVWDYNNVEFSLKPADVLANPDKYKEQYERIFKADLSFPAEVMFINNRWCIMDGIHRAVKTKLLGMKTIKVKKIHRNHLPLIEEKDV